MTLEELKYTFVNNRFQIVLISSDGKIIDSCDSLIGLRAKKGIALQEILPFMEQILEDVMHTDKDSFPYSIPLISFSLNGTDHLFNFEFFPGREKDEIVLIISSAHDISNKYRSIQQERNESVILLEKIHKQQEQLEAYTSRLENANQELERFAYIVSHDLRSPLRGISNLAEWVEEDIKEKNYAGVEENLRLLKSRVERLESMIEGILKYSRAGRGSVEPQTLNFRDLILECIDNIGSSENVDLEIEADLEEFFAPKIFLVQIFSNLIDNAIKFGTQNDCRVKISAGEKDNLYHFSVEDNGPGIHPDHRKKIFEIFQTLNSKDKIETSGVGLTIVYKLIRQAGGEIEVEDSPIGGAKFTFTWPVSKS